MVYFSIDVIGQTNLAGLGDTGNLAALAGVPMTSGVPEPGSAVMLSSGLLAAAYFARRRAAR